MNAGEKLVTFFNQLTYDRRHTIDDFYAENVDFRDPIKEFHNRADLKEYLSGQYKNTISCQFEVLHNVTQGNLSNVEWIMHLRHKYLKLGNELELQGCSLVQKDPTSGQIVLHHDYFDLSAVVVESLPGIKTIRELLGKFKR